MPNVTTVRECRWLPVPGYTDPAGAAQLLRRAAELAAVSWMPRECGVGRVGGCLLECLVMADDKPKWAWRCIAGSPVYADERPSTACKEAFWALYERYASIRDADGESVAMFRSVVVMLTAWNDSKPGLDAVLDLLLDAADDMDDLAHV